MSKKIGFFPGAFDLVHAGHIIAFEEAKKHCDYLIVGLQVDPSIDRADKNKPIMSLDERYTILRGIKWIDAILVYERDEEQRELLQWLPVDVKFVGEDWKGKATIGSVPIHYLPRQHDYSSSNLKERIKND